MSGAGATLAEAMTVAVHTGVAARSTVAARAVIASVEPLTRARVRGPFDYRLRLGQHGVDVGSLRTPFGGRCTAGTVAAMSEHSEPELDRLAEPEAVLPVPLPAHLVALAPGTAQEQAHCQST